MCVYSEIYFKESAPVRVRPASLGSVGQEFATASRPDSFFSRKPPSLLLRPPADGTRPTPTVEGTRFKSRVCRCFHFYRMPSEQPPTGVWLKGWVVECGQTDTGD